MSNAIKKSRYTCFTAPYEALDQRTTCLYEFSDRLPNEVKAWRQVRDTDLPTNFPVKHWA